MKKEVLLSLLMTTPVAFPALADISVDTKPAIDKTGGWQSILNSGVGFVDIKGTDATGGIVCPAGVKSLTRTYNLPKGKYVLDFGQEAKDRNYVVKVNGKTDFTVRVNGVDQEGFAVTAEKEDVVIELTPKAADKGFEMKSMTLTLKFANDQAASALTTLLGTVPTIKGIDNEKNITAKAEELRKAATNLTKEKATIESNITKVKAGDLSAYRDFKLYNDENEIAKTIEAFKTKVTKHNTAADTENTRYTRNVNNKAEFDRLLTERITLENEIDDLIVAITNKIKVETDATKKKELENTLEKTKALKTSVAGFKAVIEEAYADLDAVIGKTVSNQLDAYQDSYIEYKNLSGGAFDADYVAYTDFIADTSNLTTYKAIVKAYQEGQTSLSNLKGNKGSETVFAEMLIEKGAELTKIMDEVDALVVVDKDAKNKEILRLHKIKGAAGEKGKAAEAVAALNGAVKKINDVVNGATDFVFKQNDAKTKADAAVAAHETALRKAITGVNLPEQFKSEFDAEKNKVDDAIEAMKDVIKAAYGNPVDGKELTAASYATEDAAVTTALDGFNTWKNGVQSVVEANNAYLELKQAIEAVDSNGFLAGLYKTDLVAIQKDIEKLTKANRATEAPKIKTKIENLNKTAGQLIVSFDKLDCKTRLAAFDDVVASKTIVPGAYLVKGGKNVEFKATDYTSPLAKKLGAKTYREWANYFADELKKITEAHQEGMLNQTKGKIDELAADPNVDKVNTKIAEQQEAFIADGSQANVNAAEAALQDYKDRVDALEGMPLFGQKAGATAAADTKLGELKTKLSQKKYAEADGLCKTFVGTTVPGLEKTVEKALQNLKAYKDLKALKESLDVQITDLTGHNNKVNGSEVAEKAKAEFVKKITKLQNDLKAVAVKYTKAAGAADAALGVEANDKQTWENSAYSKKSGFETELGVIKTSIADTKKAITENDAKHKELLVEYETTRKQVNDIIANLDNSNIDPNGNGSFNPWADDYKKYSAQLDELAKNIANAYNDGTAAQKFDDLKNKLQKVYDEVKTNILDGYAGAYAEAVRAQNTVLLDEYGWNKAYSELEAAYNDAASASTVYQTYTNAEWKKYLGNEYGDLSELTKYITKNSDLKAEVEKYRAGLDGKDVTKPKLITEDGLQPYIAKADRYKDEISGGNGIGTNMKDAVNAKAEAYYNLKIGKIEGEDGILAANDAALVQLAYPLNNKNKKVFTVDSDTRDAMSEALKNAKAKRTSTKNLGLDMDYIANNLDKVVRYEAPEIQTIASDFWTKYCNYRYDDVNKWQTKMPTFTNDPDFNDGEAGADGKVPEENKGNQTKFKDAVAKMAAVKAQYAAVKDGLANQMTDAISALDNADLGVNGAYGKAKAIYTKAKEAHELDVNTEAAYTAYLKQIDALEAEYQKLEDYAHDLASDNALLNMAKSDLQVIRSAVDTKKPGGYDQTEKSDIKKLMDDYVPSLPAHYKSVALGEEKALNAQYQIVSSALNDAKVKGKFTDEEIKGFVKQLEDLAKKINDSATGVTAKVNAAWNDAENEAAAVKALVGLGNEMRKIELEMSQLENTLKGSWMDKTPLDSTLDGLNASYLEISNQIADAKAYLESCHPSVQARFGTPFAEYPAKLDKIKADWTEAGDNVIMQKANFTEPMVDIKAEVSAKLSEIKTAQNPFNISNDRFNTLKAEHDGFKSTADALKAKLEKSEYYVYSYEENTDKENLGTIKYQNSLAEINGLLVAALEEITERNASIDNLLEATDELPDKQTIKSKLDIFAKGLAGDEFKGSQYAYDEVQKEVKKALDNPNLLPDSKKELSALYDEQVEKWGKLDKVIPSTPDNGKTIVETIDARTAGFDAIIKALKDINVEAAEKTFLAGDLNLDGSTDVFDVTEFAGMLLDGITYEEVAAENIVKALAADMNRDKAFRVGDLTSIINEAVGNKDAASRAQMRIARLSSTPIEGANLVSTQLLSVEGGVSRYAVNISNAAEVVAGQLDLVLADGMTVVDIELAERSEGQTLYTSGDNKRVVIANMSNAAFAGSEGAVIYVEVYGEGSFSVDNVYFADRNSVEYRFSKPEGTSGIEDTVIDNNGGLKQRIYNAAGQALRGLQRGVNIIRNSDGSVSKEYHK